MSLTAPVPGFPSTIGSAPTKRGDKPDRLPFVWDRSMAIVQARGLDNTDLDSPFIVKPTNRAPILSFNKIDSRVCVRMQQRSSFFDAKWENASVERKDTEYGLALASDGTYIWGTRANEVSRMYIPGAFVPLPPTGMVYASPDPAVIESDILSIEEHRNIFQPSYVIVILDNASGNYNNPSDYEIIKGSRIKLEQGFKIIGNNYFDDGVYYFIEEWEYYRDDTTSLIAILARDAWYLLECLKMPCTMEINKDLDEYTPQDIIERLMSYIGGDLTLVSYNEGLTTFYPRMTFKIGEPAADIIKRLLNLTGHLIHFNNLMGYIVYPQTSDTEVYEFRFPEV